MIGWFCLVMRLLVGCGLWSQDINLTNTLMSCVNCAFHVVN
jgi:hypothetical protein